MESPKPEETMEIVNTTPRENANVLDDLIKAAQAKGPVNDCPDCKSVVLFGEHYHRPGCNFGRELRATEFDEPDYEFDFERAADLERDGDER